jgi:hypothetical protein
MEGGSISDTDGQKRRGQVIERAINIECMMDALISCHYLGKPVLPFMLEVLGDESCSFALKRSILGIVASARNWPDRKSAIGWLHRIGQIRNVFAHQNRQLVPGADLPTDASPTVVVDPQKVKRAAGRLSSSGGELEDIALDFEALHREFSKIAGAIEEYLSSRLGDMGFQPQRGSSGDGPG